MKIEMFDSHQDALSAIRALKNVSDAQVLDLLRCLLCATKRDTPIGNIVLDCCEAVEIQITNHTRPKVTYSEKPPFTFVARKI